MNIAKIQTEKFREIKAAHNKELADLTIDMVEVQHKMITLQSDTIQTMVELAAETIAELEAAENELAGYRATSSEVKPFAE